jgi:hypothetical protein
MDHFCPWTNSVIGLRTQKHFLLFLVYTDMLALYLYVLFMTKLVSCTRSYVRAQLMNFPVHYVDRCRTSAAGRRATRIQRLVPRGCGWRGSSWSS